ncbi:ferric reductase-like transmembrane domain-containing protein [Alkalilacustris brevis]|uniref:ferredoxin reductase family protein n=1 Tax=Alkalilacustris brevis TaxID=2026338 RepID=UPI001EE40CCE|nr:ferric reductase-like transmembrane domain-containing protein [Alkalilacustris brevis]
MPAWALALLFIAVIALPLVLAGMADEPIDFWTEAAAATGIAGGTLLLLQLVSSGRFKRLSGRIGIDVTMGFHKWAAPVGLVLVLLHPVLLAAPVDPSDPLVAIRRLWRMLSAPNLWDGVAALVVMGLLIGTALGRERLGLRYEVWRASHAVLALALVGLTVFHALKHGFYASEGMMRLFWPALAVAVVVPMLSVYLRKAISLHRHDWRIAKVRARADRLWEITVESATSRPLEFRAGQFGWLAATGGRMPVYFDHPFSIASGPQDGTRLRFLIQEAGDFTDTVGDLPEGRRVGIDAPHGSFTPDALAGAERIILIAGGVGIAPMVGLLEDMQARRETRPVHLIYAARDSAALLDRALLDPPLQAIGGKATYLADKPGGAEGVGQGPITGAHLRAALGDTPPERCATMICGPGGMTTSVTDTLHQMGLPLAAIHYERFDYDDEAGSIKDRQILTRFRMVGLAVGLAALAFALR